MWTGDTTGPNRELLARALALKYSHHQGDDPWETPQLKTAGKSGQESPLPGLDEELRPIPWGQAWADI